MDHNRLSDYQELLVGEAAQPLSQFSTDNNQNQSSNSYYGLTTKEALMKLHSDMLVEVSEMKNEFSKRKSLSWLLESISFNSELSKMRWPSVLFMTAHAIVHFIVAFILDVDNLATRWVGIQGFILISLLAFNIAVIQWDIKLRYKELVMKSEQILNLIKQCYQDKRLLKQWKLYNWSSAQAKTLFIPKSPCVHQTLTYRDESCLNLPDYLLVRGDIIHLFPGDRAPGDCVGLSKKESSEGDIEKDKILLQEGQIFHTTTGIDDETTSSEHESCAFEPVNRKNLMAQFNHAKLKKAHKGADFQMLSTPYIKSLRISLQRSHKRPVNSVEKECFVITRKYFETFVIPLVFLMSTIVTAIHYGYLDLTDSDQKIKTISIAYLLMRPSLTIMPFLPWMFPCLWLLVNAYGSARIICCGESKRGKSDENLNYDISNYSPTNPIPLNGTSMAGYPQKFENLLATPTAAGSSENKHDEDDLQDLQSNLNCIDILRVTIDLIIGKSGHVWRSSNLLQVLGCLTSLCCIDKVGILSWSNPTPEKVFVLTKNQDEESRYLIKQHEQSDTDSHNQADNISNQQNMLTVNSEMLDSQLNSLTAIVQDDQISNNQQSIKIDRGTYVDQSRSEILDVSQSSICYRGSKIDPRSYQQHSRLQFDDLNWRKYISNLKPLGLAIMMNNCCEQSFGDYFRFYKHVSYESILRCKLTPVVKRRCTCGLSKLIGFSKDAVESYKYVDQVGIYKLIDPSSIKKGKLAPSLENSTRLKLPFPNMTCNIQQDIGTGGYQVFSQGTGDIVLDSCVEYWNGQQLMPLDDLSRKKIMDFYHRSSITSYCSAFAYTPLLKENRFNNFYIELPADNIKTRQTLRKLANEHQEELLQNQLISLTNQPLVESNKLSQPHLSIQENQLPLNPSDTSIISNFHSPIDRERVNDGRIMRKNLSAEELLKNKEPVTLTNSTDKKRKSLKTQQVKNIIDELTDQVFVGMVAMQYQACPDFVALVEQLEHACIRFVHFSKENELRSRVFSEKMGLESGWNCHISLQSDQDLDKADKVVARNTVPQECDQFNEDTLKLGSFNPTTRVSNLLIGQSHKSTVSSKGKFDTDDITSCGLSINSDNWSLQSWKSLPSIVMKLTARIAKNRNFSTPNHKTRKTTKYLNYPSESSAENLASDVVDEMNLEENNHNQIDNQGFESLAFDMSNRAKLPKGIENIRPHLQTVDNVPLQVSLFTDCTPDLTKEMIEIMQEYGEIVCVIGSAASRLNTPVFLQANASIAVEPLLPQCCTRTDQKQTKSSNKNAQKGSKNRRKRHKRKDENVVSVPSAEPIPKNAQRINNPRDRLGIGPHDPSKTIKSRQEILSSSSSGSASSSSSSSTNSSSSSTSNTFRYSTNFHNSDSNPINDSDSDDDSSSSLAQEFPEPSSLASKLASLPCSYCYNRKDPVNLYRLIMEARHFTFKMKNTFVCMICFALSISSAQFLASILFLPPMLSSGLTIWLTIVVVPLMSFSLMNTTMDSQVMKIAVGKNLQLKPENITFFVICYLLKFIPSIIVVVLSFGLIIAHSCKLTGFGSSSVGPCWMFTYVQHSNATSTDTGDEDLLWSTHLLTAQVCAAFLLVLYFIVISAGFVHRSHLMWQRSPMRNRLWVIISLSLLIGQLFYNQLVLHVNLSSSKNSYEFLASLPLHIWIISFSWPLLVIGINLLVKRAEIKATIRQQRRARFDFNTKLGMNSPF